METASLHLVLKRKWWDMIASGKKTEEYRELKPYWTRRILQDADRLPCENLRFSLPVPADYGKILIAPRHETVTFHLGYTATTMTFRIQSVLLGKGNPLWGAPMERNVIIIRLAERTDA